MVMEAARTSETSVDIPLRTRRYIPEDSENHVFLSFVWHYITDFLLCIEVSYSHIIRHTVGLLWMNNQSVAEASTYTGKHNI
jgi:hypothetical protein